MTSPDGCDECRGIVFVFGVEGMDGMGGLAEIRRNTVSRDPLGSSIKYARCVDQCRIRTTSFTSKRIRTCQNLFGDP